MTEKVRFYLQLPWTIKREVQEEADKRTIELTVEELPELLVVGETDEEAERRFWPALETLIETYVEDGEAPPIPVSYQRILQQINAARAEQVRVPTLQTGGIDHQDDINLSFVDTATVDRHEAVAA